MSFLYIIQIYKEKSIDIPLKSGLISGNKIVFNGKGHHINNTKSDLIFVINILPHNVFYRENNSTNLYIDIELTLYQALFGFNKVITHLDGRNIRIQHTGKTDFNNIKKIPNEGMKNISGDTKGDLYVRFLINMPNINNISNETKLELKTILQEPNTDTNIESTINSVLNSCKKEEIEKVTKILFNIKYNNEQQSHNHHKNQSQSQPQTQQCVQQ